MRLIDAHKLYEQYETAMRELVKNTNCENISLEALSLLCGANLIADAPTVDAAPVKHGRWTEQHIDYASDCAIDEIQELKCSVCGLYHTTPYIYNVTKYKYCPNCGARMDLEEQHENN